MGWESIVLLVASAAGWTTVYVLGRMERSMDALNLGMRAIEEKKDAQHEAEELRAEVARLNRELSACRASKRAAEKHSGEGESWSSR